MAIMTLTNPKDWPSSLGIAATYFVPLFILIHVLAPYFGEKCKDYKAAGFMFCCLATWISTVSCFALNAFVSPRNTFAGYSERLATSSPSLLLALALGTLMAFIAGVFFIGSCERVVEASATLEHPDS
ncbi:MAG: hypothetical protein KDI66_09535 [Xanthomonadales bacterium]|nr:hypothetical protein [Xanthomonadales bacterium]